MNNRDYGIWLIPILMALAIYLPSSTGRPEAITTSPPSTAETKAESGKAQIKDLASGHPLLRFRGTDKANLAIEQLQNYQVKFLITTVPDPQDSSLGYLFDRHVSAIQLAAQAAGYVPDNFYLPWLGKKSKGTNSSDNRQEEGLANQREPGIILFRKRDEKSLLLVYLIRETPTTGIQKAAFANAIGEINNICKSLREQQNSGECQIVRLLAPTFSGTADSLVIALKQWRNDRTNGNWPNEFKIVSGSATAITVNTINELKELSAQFSVTIHPDIEVWDAFYHYLTSSPINAESSQIARLVEGTTAYGQASRKTQVLTLSYPFHISQLRNAAEKAKGTAKETPTPPPSLGPRNLRLSLEETDIGQDVIPPFSTFDTFSVELVISNILSTISRERIRYLGIISTDVRDQIFLAQEIRKYAPDVVLFTLSSDLIYLHSDVNLSFQGMLVVSTYPLFSRNQLWTYPFANDNVRLQFPNDSSQGVYNAMLALLNESKPNEPKLLEFGWPFDFGQKPGEPRTPPIWLSAVGKNGIWPIQLLSTSQEPTSKYLYAGLGNDDKAKPIRSWFLSPGTFFLLLCISAALSVISVFLLARFPSRWALRFRRRWITWLRNKKIWPLMNLSDAAFRKNRPQRRLYLFAFCVTVLTLGIIINRVIIRVFICNSLTGICPTELNLLEEKFALFQFASLAIILLLELPILIAAVVLFKVIYPPREISGWVRRIYLLLNPIALVPLVILILSLLYAVQVTSLDPPDALFFYLRLLNPGNGLSPLLPLLFVGAAGIFWLISNLQRLRLLEEFPARPASTDLNTYTIIERSRYNLEHRLMCPCFSLPGAYFVLLLVGIPCSYLFLCKLTPALERSFFYWFFGIAFAAVYIALSFSFWRLWVTWWSTRDLLRRLAAHPIYHAYKTLVENFPRTPRISFSNSSTRFSALEFSVDQAMSLVTSDPRLGLDIAKLEKLNACIHDAQESTFQSNKEEALSNWSPALRLRSYAHGSLSQASRLVADLLRPYWSSTATTLKSEDKQSWYISAEYFLAARTAVFIHHLFLHFENLLFSGMAGLLLMLLAVSSYPFQPADQLLLFNWLIILTAVLLTVLMLIQINRNSIISLLTATDPGRVNWNREFVMKLLIYGTVPILALVGAQFPESLKNVISFFSGSQASK